MFIREQRDFCGRLVSSWPMLLSSTTIQNLDNDLFLGDKIEKDFKKLENDWSNGTDIILCRRLKKSREYFN